MYLCIHFHSCFILGLSFQAKTGTFLKDAEKPSCLNIYTAVLQNECLARKPFLHVDIIKQADEPMKYLSLLYKVFKEFFLNQQEHVRRSSILSARKRWKNLCVRRKSRCGHVSMCVHSEMQENNPQRVGLP